MEGCGVVKIKALFAALLLTGLVLAATCGPGWEETVLVQVLDSNGLPLPNASVQATYQLDYTTGKGYTTTEPVKTNSTGMVKIHMKNLEIISERVDCSFTIIATYDNQRTMKDFQVGQHPNILTIPLAVSRVVFNVFDQNGNPLPGALILIRNMTTRTNSQGQAVLEVGKGDAKVVVLYKEGALVRDVKIVNNKEQINVEFPIYSLTLRVVDDNGDPLPEAVVKIEGETYYPDKDGYVRLPMITTRNPRIAVFYKGTKRELWADLSAKQNYGVIFDFTPPVIKDIKPVVENGRVRLIFSAVDPGKTPSGIAPEGLVVKVITSSGRHEEVTPYVIGPGEYKADLGRAEPGVWNIEIDAKDDAGNEQRVKGYITVKETSSSGNNNGTGSNPAPEKKGGFNILLIILGLGVLVVIILIVAHYLQEEGIL